MIKKIFLVFLLVGHLIIANGQNASLKVYPSFWWVGMKNPHLQLLIHGSNIGTAVVSLNYPGVRLEKIHRVENKNYLFLDLLISSGARAGKLLIKLKEKQGADNIISYELKTKDKNDGMTRQLGVTAADFIYMLMPDRFANGDPSNDTIAGMRDNHMNRDSMFFRHGGDLQGVINHLDYFKELGVTTLWLTPVIENDMPFTNEGGVMRTTYHGYAFTDHYQVDPRLGGNAAYKKLVEAAHSKGLKIIQDAVYNHVGIAHWFIKDLPMKNWIHQWPHYTNTSYRDQPLVDPHAAEIDRKIMTDGWFTPFMPDLDQKNPYVANFLIQHAIWTTEYFGIDGWRIDTYPYNDRDFMNRCNQALLEEFPRLHIFGEVWVQSPVDQAYFTRNKLNIPFKSNLPGVTDFQAYFNLIDGLNQPFGWSDGLNRIYNNLANDLIYQDPMKNVLFLDNHDLDRFYSLVGEDFNKFKMGVTWLLTSRGIPQIYYGTEILMKNFKNPSDAKVREDFPGGWPTDKINKFVAAGRTGREQEAFDYIKKLALFRLHSPAITRGRLMQYLPEKGIYVYFRYDSRETVMIVMNSNQEASTLITDRFVERLQGFSKARNVITEEEVSLHLPIQVPARSALVLKLMK